MERIEAETLLEGTHLRVTRGSFRRADGSEVRREVVEHPGSVAIVAHDDDAVYLVSQPREAVGEDALLELPAGTLDVEGETPLECARRELAEEAGLRAEAWSELQVVYPSPGYTDEVVTLFDATGLSETSAEGDEDEQIEVVRLLRSEIERVLPEIRDATTLIGLLMVSGR